MAEPIIQIRVTGNMVTILFSDPALDLFQQVADKRHRCLSDTIAEALRLERLFADAPFWGQDANDTAIYRLEGV